MKKSHWQAAILATALTLTIASGCSAKSIESATPVPTIDSAATPTEPAETPTAPVASVAQWASRIASSKSDWEEREDAWKNAVCSSIAAAEAADCQALLLAMTYTAETISLDTAGIASGRSDSLGEVPPEIAAVYAATVEAATNAVSASEDVECPGEHCTGTAFSFLRTWDDLGDALAAWEPWL